MRIVSLRTLNVSPNSEFWKHLLKMSKRAILQKSEITESISERWLGRFHCLLGGARGQVGGGGGDGAGWTGFHRRLRRSDPSRHLPTLLGAWRSQIPSEDMLLGNPAPWWRRTAVTGFRGCAQVLLHSHEDPREPEVGLMGTRARSGSFSPKVSIAQNRGQGRGPPTPDPDPSLHLMSVAF